jgi:flagellar biosynthesis protein FlhG
MIDQAQKLRLLARNLKEKVEAEISGFPRPMRVIVVTSGKGGVGKTNLTLNLALAFEGLGLRTIILDADLGLANIDVILGISPRHSLYHVITGKKPLPQVITETQFGFKLIAGGAGIEELANLRDWQLQSFVNDLGELEGEADILLIDTGAGIARNVLSFVLAADEIILVTTPEPTSLMDAYSLLKVLCGNKREKKVGLVVNKAASEQDGYLTAGKLQFVSERFLQFRPDYIGHIVRDPWVVKSVMLQQPLLVCNPNAEAAVCVNELAVRLCHRSGLKGSGIKVFFQQLSLLFK